MTPSFGVTVGVSVLPACGRDTVANETSARATRATASVAVMRPTVPLPRRPTFVACFFCVTSGPSELRDENQVLPRTSASTWPSTV